MQGERNLGIKKEMSATWGSSATLDFLEKSTIGEM
jgi:hypothetical protein